MINMGYLAQEFAQNTMQNKKVMLKTTPKVTSECSYAKIKINGINYNDILKNSGFGIFKNKNRK